MELFSGLFSKEIKVLETLSKYSIVFGILDEDKNKVVDVSVLNTDGTKANTKLTVKDVMYFTENGTMTIPAKHFLDEIFKFADKEVTKTINECFNGALFNNWSEHNIDTKFNELAIKIQNYSYAASDTIIQKTNTLGKILNQDDENSYIYDLKKLSKYIKCRVVKS